MLYRNPALNVRKALAWVDLKLKDVHGEAHDGRECTESATGNVSEPEL
jgi:hypothetical protein